MLREKDRSQVYKVAVNAALGSFLFGYELVNISSMQLLFQNKNGLTNEQTRAYLSIITASLPLMAILGSVMLKPLIQRYKGRYLMIYMDVAAIIGMIIQDISMTFWALFIGRLILGFCVGINSGLVAQYTFSVTPTTLSGSVGALRQVFLNVGVAIGYALGYLINADNVNDQLNWRILISFPIITCVVRSILLLTVLPYQIPLARTRNKNIERMEKYYYKIYENYALGNQVQLETNKNNNNINTNINNGMPSEEPAIAQSPSLIISDNKNLAICIILACSNQFCGINAIIFYAKQLFMRITDNNNSLSQFIIILLGLVQILATFIGGKLMDKYSKRYFLFVGEICLVFILAFIFLFKDSIQAIIILIFLHTIAYSFSIGQLLLFYAAKMLDNTGYVVMVNWFATFLVAISAQYMMKYLGIGNMCLIFCILLTICLLILSNNIPTDKELLEKQMSLLSKPDIATKIPQQANTNAQSISNNDKSLNLSQNYQNEYQQYFAQSDGNKLKQIEMQKYSNSTNNVEKQSKSLSQLESPKVLLDNNI